MLALLLSLFSISRKQSCFNVVWTKIILVSPGIIMVEFNINNLGTSVLKKFTIVINYPAVPKLTQHTLVTTELVQFIGKIDSSQILEVLWSNWLLPWPWLPTITILREIAKFLAASSSLFVQLNKLNWWLFKVN